MTQTPQGPTTGRRVAEQTDAPRNRRSLVVTIAVPIVAVVAMAATSGSPTPSAAPTPPTDAPLTSLQLACPEGITAGGSLAVASTKGDGEVLVRLGEDRSRVSVEKDRTTTVRDVASPVVVDGRDELAPGLVASRLDPDNDAATSCRTPQPDYWFTGVGAASIHTSRLELVNPDSGPAVADIDIYGRDGLLQSDDVRGVTVRGGTSTTIDLAQSAPNRFELAVHVTVTRGRLGAALVNRISDTATSTDWLPAQSTPTTRNVLLGLAQGGGDRELVVANPSDDQARVQLKVIGSGSTFSPVGVDEISVPPQSVVITDVSKVVGKAVAKEESGLMVTSDVPVTAGLRSLAGGDLSHAATASPATEAAVLLPEGDATLVMAAPFQAGSATVTSYDAEGARLKSQRLAAKRLTSVALDLPAKTSLVVFRADGAPLPGAVRVVTDGGVVVQPLTDLVLTGLIPAVSAGPYVPQSAS